MSNKTRQVYVYSNTLEALQNRVALGYRLIEPDFVLRYNGRE